MKQELEKLCTEFIANRDTVKDTFRWENAAVYPICANLFCASGRLAEKDRLIQCRKVISEQTGLFSKFKGKLGPILSCLLALDDHPQERMALAIDYNHLLKQAFKDTEYLALIAFLLPRTGERSLMEERIARGKQLFRRMDKEHPVLTNQSDSVFAMTLAFSEKTDDALIEDLEACYQALKKYFSSSDAVQTVAQILAMAAGTPEEKTQRVIDLYDALQEAGVEYGRSSELAPLAALSLTDLPLQTLVDEIKEVDAFLKDQKSYGSVEKNQRALHAAMIVSDQYAVTGRVNSTVMANTLDILISKQRSLYFSLLVNTIQVAAEILGSTSKKETDNTENRSGEAPKGEPGSDENAD
ncbi:MAG: DUF4003 family protein [Firmicutes bacterium]|nr:DUF4003 family protein [Bacillota bacterium]